MKRHITITFWLLFYLIQVSGQVKIHSVYMGVGYQDTKPIIILENPNEAFSLNIINTGVSFTGLIDFGFGIVSQINKIPKLKIDFSLDYLTDSKYEINFSL